MTPPLVAFFPLWLVMGLTVGWFIDRVRSAHAGLRCGEAQELIDHQRGELAMLTTCSNPQDMLATYSVDDKSNTFREIRSCHECRHCHNREELDRELREAAT